VTEAATEDEPGGSIEQKAAGAKLWVLVGYGGSQTIRLAGNLILTRLLTEDAFGLMALMTPIIVGIHLFSDIGIGPSLIQNERRDEAFVNTAWTMQVGRGIGIFLVAAAAAYPVSVAYPNYPEVRYLLPIVATTSLLEGFGSTAFFTLNRDLNVRRIEIVEVLSQVFGLLVKVVWALLAPSVLALVAGGIAVQILRLALGHLMLPGTRARFRWEKEAATELARFGRWIFLSTVLVFLAGQTDKLVFGGMVTRDELGVYGVAAMIAALPSMALSRLSQQVIFPTYSRLRERDGDFKSAFMPTRRGILIAGAWGFAGLIAGGPTGVELVYDDRWLAAGWIIQLLSAGGWLLLLESTYGAALLARGVPKWISLAAVAKIVGMVTLIPLGYWLGERWIGEGFPGAVAGYAGAELFRYVVAFLVCRYLGYSGLKQDAGLTLWMAITGLAGYGLATWMDSLGLHVVTRALAVAVAVTALWAPFGGPMLKRRVDAWRARRRGAA